MKNIGKHLQEDYLYSKKFFKDNELYSSEKAIMTIDDILRAHYLITDYFENHITLKPESSFYGLLKPHMLGSAYSRQFVAFSGNHKYSNKLDYCATLFYGLDKAHAFNDGNKRTALLTLIYHLYKCGRIPTSSKKEFENLAVNVAADTYSSYPFIQKYKGQDDFEVKMISHFLRKNTRQIENRYQSITFQELQHALSKHDVTFTEGSKGFIDVIVQKRHIVHNKPVKLCTISYPGSKRQVLPKTINLILDKYKETIGHELDVDVVYAEAEPLYRMIEEFEGPLMRLKDR